MSYQRKSRNIRDLAEKAGVTAATVSLALHDSPRLSSEVKERIRRIAAEDDFTPRRYTRRLPARPPKRFSHLGPILFVDNHEDEEDPVGEGLFAAFARQMNLYGVEFSSINDADLVREPEVVREFSGVFFYNDPRIAPLLPEEIPSVQVFGWEKLRANGDRVTTDDSGVVDIAVDFFRHVGVARVIQVWRHDILREDHPRLRLFRERMEAVEIPVTGLCYRKYASDFVDLLREAVAAGSENLGFFGVSALCGLKLCCGLDSLGLMKQYGASNVVVCDNTVLVKSFWPCPNLIDLNLSVMADRALEALFYRMEHAGTPGCITYQSPRLLPSPSMPVS